MNTKKTALYEIIRRRHSRVSISSLASNYSDYMKLSSIEYDVIMQAIQDTKASIADDEFIDPYGEAPENYTNENLLAALLRVEEKIISANIPLI